MAPLGLQCLFLDFLLKTREGLHGAWFAGLCRGRRDGLGGIGVVGGSRGDGGLGGGGAGFAGTAGRCEDFPQDLFLEFVVYCGCAADAGGAGTGFGGGRWGGIGRRNGLAVV